MKTVVKTLILLTSITLISCDKEEPVVTLNVDKTTASVGETINIEFSAQDNKKIENYFVLVNLFTADSSGFGTGTDLAQVNPYGEKELALTTYQYVVPATNSNGDSLVPGCYLEISGGALDKYPNSTTLYKYVTIQ
jgi:hypothetical protein